MLKTKVLQHHLLTHILEKQVPVKHKEEVSKFLTLDQPKDVQPYKMESIQDQSQFALMLQTGVNIHQVSLPIVQLKLIMLYY